MVESPFDNIKFPRFDELPFRKSDPDSKFEPCRDSLQRSSSQVLSILLEAIWGFYEHVSGSTTPDELGALNLLTQQRILKASRTEIQFGKVCSLNWAMHKPVPSKFGRKGLEHKVKGWQNQPRIVDDEISLNTQCGSQWDGFRHFGHPSGETRTPLACLAA